MTTSKAQREAEARERLRDETIDAALGAMLNDSGGRAALYWVWAECGLRTVYTMPDALMTYRSLGRNAASNALEERCKRVNFRNWLTLLEENDGPRRGAKPPEAPKDEGEGEE